MSDSQPAPQPTSLKRAVRRWEVVALAINDVVGSGVYLLPAAAVALLGPSSLWAVVLAGAAVGLVVLCFAEAATYFDEPGSAYLYTRTAFGDLAGFQVGWMAWLTRVVSVASLSAGFAQALGFLWPQAEVGAGRAWVVSVPLAVLAWINLAGVKAGARTSVVLAVAKLLPLFLFVALGVFVADWSMILEQAATADGSGTQWGAAALLLLYAYAGFENTAAAAGEFRNPKRDVPFALFFHLGLVVLLYVAVQAVVMAILPNSAASQTPLADAARLFLGSWGGTLLTVGAAVSILGTNANSVFAAPRYLFALGRDGYGPQGLAAVHPRFRTPWIALLATLAIAWPMALYGSFFGLAALSVVARLFTYVGTAAAIPVLRRKLTAPEGAFRIPFGPVVPILAIGLAFAFASGAGRDNLVSAAVAVAAGFVVYGLRRRDAAVGAAGGGPSVR